MQGKKPYTEKLFTSFQLSQHVPQDNFYRRLKELLDIQWLYKSTKNYYGREGQQSIDPVVFSCEPSLILGLCQAMDSVGANVRRGPRNVQAGR
jgi:hypothetical protein